MDDFQDTDKLMENEFEPHSVPGVTMEHQNQQVSKKYSTFLKNQLVFNEINMLIHTKEKGKKISKQILSQCRYVDRLLVYV